MGKTQNHNDQPYLEFVEDSDFEVADLEIHEAIITLHTKREPLIIRDSNYKGNRRISIRYHYPDKRDGILRPGRRGVEIPLEAARLVAQGINDLMDLIETPEET